MNVPAVETQADPEGWSETLGSNSGPVGASWRRGAKSDEQLARAAGRGDVAAFEALYERHHRALLSFSRHMLGRAHDAEDVVQHTFLAADRAFRDGKVPKTVRPWLYTVARNRCVSLLRARRDDAGLPDAGVPSTENLVADTEHREDLRALLGDLRGLPDDQRAALLLTELGDLTHAEVAKVIGVRASKVKALVFQAREALLASAHARAIPCRSIREELATASGAALRRRHLKHHLVQCEGCAAYAADVRAQRAALAALLPVVPTLALRDSVLGGLASGGAAAGAGAGAGIGAGVLANSTAAKLLATLAVTGVAAGGGVAVKAHEDASPAPTERKAERGASAPAPPAAPAAAGAPAEPGTELRHVPQGAADANGRRRSADRDARRRGRRDRDATSRTAPGASEQGRRGERGRHTAPGQLKPKPANGHGKDSAPGQLKAPKEKAAPPAKAKAKAPRLVPARRPPKAYPTPKPRTKPPTAGGKTAPAPVIAPDPDVIPPDSVEEPAPSEITPPPGQAAKS